MSSAASRMSAATANSAPPPSAWPLRTAMVGVGNPAMRSQIERIRKAMVDASHSQRGQFLQVATGYERAIAGAGEGKRPGALSPVEVLVQLVHRLQRDGVAGV